MCRLACNWSAHDPARGRLFRCLSASALVAGRLLGRESLDGKMSSGLRLGRGGHSRHLSPCPPFSFAEAEMAYHCPACGHTLGKHDTFSAEALAAAAQPGTRTAGALALRLPPFLGVPGPASSFRHAGSCSAQLAAPGLEASFWRK